MSVSWMHGLVAVIRGQLPRLDYVWSVPGGGKEHIFIFKSFLFLFKSGIFL